MSPIERSMVPPTLRTRSASSSVGAKICSCLLVKQEVVVAECGPLMPWKFLVFT